MNTFKLHFQGTLQTLSKLRSEPIKSDDLKIYVETETSMIDGKMCSILTGTGGAWCQYCDATRAQGNDVTEILKGFHINRTSAAAKENWQKLLDGYIRYSDKERCGQTNECLLEDDARFYGILHSELRSLDFVEKILYHLASCI